MSSDCFDVRVVRVNGKEVVFDLLTGTAGGYDDLCTSRSFALVLLSDALARAPDLLPGSWDDPAKRAEAQRLRSKSDASALRAALSREPSDWFVSPSWMRENVGRFIERTELLERRNAIGEDALQEREREISASFGDAVTMDRYAEYAGMRWQRCHNYTLRVVARDVSWTEHLEPGLLFPTTGYEVWDDKSPAPPSPTPVALAPSPKPSPKKKAAKMPAPKKAAKKPAPTRKAAAKKPAAKKTPAARGKRKPAGRR